MIDLDLPSTSVSPAIRTDAARGLVELSGDSYPENSFDLYQPLIAWVREYLAVAGRSLRLELALVYLNTSSVRSVMDVFDLLEASHAAGGDVCVRWTYEAENERVGELAEDFKQDVSFPFEIVARA